MTRRSGSLAPLAVALAVLAAGSVRSCRTDAEPVSGPVPDAWLAGLDALRGGDAEAGKRALAGAEAELGVAPPALLRARLHAALRAGDFVDAELTVEKLALRTGAEALRHFVVGLAEYARAGRAERQAKQPGADPTAYQRAIRHATAAALAFRTASLSHGDRDWPAARRNAERALIRATAIRREKDKADRDRKRAQDQKQEPDPKDTEEIKQELQLTQDPGLLSAVDLQALLQRLAAAEEEKRGVRRAARSVRSAGVEQDW